MLDLSVLLKSMKITLLLSSYLRYELNQSLVKATRILKITWSCFLQILKSHLILLALNKAYFTAN